MKVIELEGTFDENGKFTFKQKIEIFRKKVKVIIMIPDEKPEGDQTWIEELSLDNALDFLESEEDEDDLFFIEDGEPASDN